MHCTCTMRAHKPSSLWLVPFLVLGPNEDLVTANTVDFDLSPSSSTGPSLSSSPETGSSSWVHIEESPLRESPGSSPPRGEEETGGTETEEESRPERTCERRLRDGILEAARHICWVLEVYVLSVVVVFVWIVYDCCYQPLLGWWRQQAHQCR